MRTLDNVTATLRVPYSFRDLADQKGSIVDISATCAGCGSADVVLGKCGRCKRVLYCSKTCQIGDWKAHRKLCKEMQQRRMQAP